MRYRINKFANMCIGLAVATLSSLTTVCILSMYFQNNDLIVVFSALIIFLFMSIVWLKTKSHMLKLILIFTMIITYIVGRNYALKTYQTYIDAQNLFNKINSEEAEWMNETDPNRYLEGQRRYTEQLKVVSETPDKALGLGKKYYEDIYILQKEALNHNEKLASGEIVWTKEESSKQLEEYNKKARAIIDQKFALPFWVGYFKIENEEK